MTAIHIIITGRVQGVGYRAWAVKTARALGVKGWVRNRHDGSVEAVFVGEQQAIDALLNKCQKGPLMAKVTGLRINGFSGILDNDGFVEKETV